uniref:ubiquitinyl hydrolase 1 n=1 Tax=Syphacia muris TaxID=451379 RepID=A0A0N5AWI1_9BILA
MNEEVEKTCRKAANIEKKMLYHEKQHLQLCLLHTLNNLFQRKEFSKSELDRIAEDLHPSYWFNKHRSFWGTGNYDVNVLFAALQTRDYSVVWFDARRSAAIIDLEKVFGFVFNFVSTSNFIPFWRGRHWFGVRCIDGCGYFNFDSKLSEPMLIDNFVRFADEKLVNGYQMMLVLPCELAEDWLLPQS